MILLDSVVRVGKKYYPEANFNKEFNLNESNNESDDESDESNESDVGNNLDQYFFCFYKFLSIYFKGV